MFSPNKTTMDINLFDNIIIKILYFHIPFQAVPPTVLSTVAIGNGKGKPSSCQLTGAPPIFAIAASPKTKVLTGYLFLN